MNSSLNSLGIIGKAFSFCLGSIFTDILEGLVFSMRISKRSSNYPLSLVDEPLIESAFKSIGLPPMGRIIVNEFPMEGVSITTAHLLQPVNEVLIIELFFLQ